MLDELTHVSTVTHSKMTFNEYEEHIRGSKYQQGRDVKDIAKDVRADIKAGITSGAFPASAKYSVTIDRFSMGCELNVSVSNLPFLVYNPERVKQDMGLIPREPIITWMSEPASSLSRRLEAVLEQYQYVDSHSQSDYLHVNFYAHVVVHEARNEREEIESALKRGIDVRAKAS